MHRLKDTTTGFQESTPLIYSLSAEQKAFSFDFKTPDVQNPLSIAEGKDELQHNYDFDSADVPWAKTGLFKMKVKVEEWKEFESLAIDFQNRINSCGPNSENVQLSQQCLDIFRRLLRTLQPHCETELGYLMGTCWYALNWMLRASNPTREHVRIVHLGTEVSKNSYQKHVTHFDSHFQKIVYPIQCEPDFILMDEGHTQDAETTIFPVASIEQKGPRHPITLKEIHEQAFYSGFAGEGLEEGARFARFFQGYLDGKDDWGNVGKIHAQAVVDALRSHSGCAVLYCHTWSRALHVQGMCTSENGQPFLKVRVSRAFACSEELSSLLCAATLFDFALNSITGRVRETKEQTLKQTLKQTVKQTLKQTLKRLEEMAKCPALIGGTNRPEAGIEQVVTGSFAGVQSTAHGNQQGGAQGSGDGRKSRTELELQRWSMRWTEEISKYADEGLLPLFWDAPENMRLDRMLEICKECDNDVIASVGYNSSSSVLGKGCCGVVKGTIVDGEQAAVKFWSEEKKKRRPLLFNEMAIYCYLATEHSYLMGDAVPRLFGVGMHYWVGAVIVMERVREKISNRMGSFFVGEEEVSGKTLDLIKRAAQSSLRKLHSAGVVHGSVGLRNLLVARVEGNGADQSECWHAWWVDFGRSRLHLPERSYIEERRVCEKLFVH